VARALDHDGVTLVDSCDRDPVHAVGQGLEESQLLGRERVGHAVEAGAGQDLHVLAVPAPETDPTLPLHVAVAVHEKGWHAGEDLVHADAVTLLHAELGVGCELDDSAHDFVARDDRERARVGNQLDALVGGEVAAAQAACLHPQNRAAGRRIGNRELTHLVALVPEEDDGPAPFHGR
jgi:hypothetical protein